jgi:hypothetical protein
LTDGSKFGRSGRMQRGCRPRRPARGPQCRRDRRRPRDMVKDRAKVSDHIAMTGASLKAETMIQMS